MAPARRLIQHVSRWLRIAGALAALLLLLLAPSLRNYYLPRRTVRIVPDLRYLPDSVNPRHVLDLYLPTLTVGPWPVAVFVHGGYWQPQDRRFFQPLTGLHGCVGVALANAGVATAVIGYRQFPEAPSLAAALDDVASALRYVVDHIEEYGGDRRRIFVIGHSAGGLLTQVLAVGRELHERGRLSPSDFRGFVSLGGLSDLPAFLPQVDGSLAQRIRQSAGDASGLLRFSPRLQLRAEHPPLLLVVGDREVPSLLAQHRAMSAALHSVGGDFKTVEVAGLDHMDLVIKLAQRESLVKNEILNFIVRHR